METTAVIKGYYISTGFMGWVTNGSSGSYFLFPTEREYVEYVREL